MNTILGIKAEMYLYPVLAITEEMSLMRLYGDLIYKGKNESHITVTCIQRTDRVKTISGLYALVER